MENVAEEGSDHLDQGQGSLWMMARPSFWRKRRFCSACLNSFKLPSPFPSLSFFDTSYLINLFILPSWWPFLWPFSQVYLHSKFVLSFFLFHHSIVSPLTEDLQQQHFFKKCFTLFRLTEVRIHLIKEQRRLPVLPPCARILVGQSKLQLCGEHFKAGFLCSFASQVSIQRPSNIAEASKIVKSTFSMLFGTLAHQQLPLCILDQRNWQQQHSWTVFFLDKAQQQQQLHCLRRCSFYLNHINGQVRHTLAESLFSQQLHNPTHIVLIKKLFAEQSSHAESHLRHRKLGQQIHCFRPSTGG